MTKYRINFCWDFCIIIEAFDIDGAWRAAEKLARIFETSADDVEEVT